MVHLTKQTIFQPLTSNKIRLENIRWNKKRYKNKIISYKKLKNSLINR